MSEPEGACIGGEMAQDPSPSQSGPRQVSYSRNLIKEAKGELENENE